MKFDLELAMRSASNLKRDHVIVVPAGEYNFTRPYFLNGNYNLTLQGSPGANINIIDDAYWVLP